VLIAESDGLYLQLGMKWYDYAGLGLSLLGLFALGYSWVYWYKIGHLQQGKRTGRAVTALMYNTLLPGLLLALVSPRYYVPYVDQALSGLPFATLGLVLALLTQGKLRRLLAMCVLVWYLMFAALIPALTPPGKSWPNQTAIQHTGCQAGG
jgi:hypothetical protein